MILSVNASPGDLLEIVPWVCEGTERPWGFRSEVVQDITHTSGAEFRMLTRSRNTMVRLQEGEVCLVLKSAVKGHPAIDPFCTVLIRGMRLGVYTRFLRQLS